MYDIRVGGSESMVATFDVSSNKILKSQFLLQKPFEFIVGTRSGEIMLWDIRQQASTLTIDSGITDDMTCFDAHERASIVAW
jgi:hypothetical protein